jgi:hypothetical protein
MKEIVPGEILHGCQTWLAILVCLFQKIDSLVFLAQAIPAAKRPPSAASSSGLWVKTCHALSDVTAEAMAYLNAASISARIKRRQNSLDLTDV